VAMVLFERMVESSGDLLRPHFPALKVLFSAALTDQTSIMVRTAALKAVGQLVPFLQDENEFALVGDLIPAIIQVLSHCVQLEAQGDDANIAVSTAFEILDDVLECPVSIINQHMMGLTEIMLNIVKNTELELNSRERAANFFHFSAMRKSKLLMKQKLVQPIVSGLLNVLCESEEGTPEDETSAHEFAGQALNMLCINVPNKVIFPMIAQFVSQAAPNASPVVRKAAMTILLIAAEGCAEPLKQSLGQVLPEVLRLARDPDPEVREASCLAIGQFAEYLQPEIFDYYQETLPTVFSLLDDPVTTVQEKACYGLYSFCEGLEDKIMLFINELMPKLVLILQNPATKREVQEMSVAAISSVIAAAKEQFKPYANDVLQLMQVLMTQTGDTELKLRARATECVGVIAAVVGRDVIEPVAQPFIELAVAGVQLDYSELREYTYGFFSAMVEVFGEDFATGPLLETCTGFLLQSLQASDTVSSVNLAATAFEDSEDEDEESSSRRMVNVRTDLLDEKASACMCLANFAKFTKAKFLPYVEKTLEVIQHSTGYMHPDVRANAQDTCHGLMVCVNAAFPSNKWNPGLPPTAPLRQEIVAVNNTTLVMHMNAIAGDDDRDVVSKACDCLAETIDLLGPASIHLVLEDLCGDVLQLLEGTHPCQTEADEDEEDDAEVDDHQELLDSVTDLVVAIAKALGPSFAQVFPTFMKPVLKYCRTKNDDYDRSMGLGCMAEMINAMGGEGAMPYLDKVLPVVVNGLEGETSDVRRNAVFCAGVLCHQCPAQMSQHYTNLLTKMQHVFSPTEDDATRDNGCGAVARMILSSPQSLPLSQVLPVMLAALPITSDFQEADPVATCLAALIESGDPTVGQHAGKITFILVSSICITEPPLPAHTAAAAIAAIKKMPPQALQEAFSMLSPALQARAQAQLH